MRMAKRPQRNWASVGRCVVVIALGGVLVSPSITFTPPGSGSASDIAIRDGQAAIEFRTYYSGVSIIEATSSGLASSSVTITSQGSPAWVEGTTPRVPPRPYQP